MADTNEITREKHLRALLNDATPERWAAADDDAAMTYGITSDGPWIGDFDSRAERDLAVALRNAAPALLDVVEAARAVQEASRRRYLRARLLCGTRSSHADARIVDSDGARAASALRAALRKFDEVRRG